MKKVKNILKNLILVLTFITSSYCQDLEANDITITLTLLNTGWFTYDSWQNNSNLWYVDIKNQTPVAQQYRIYYQLKGGDEIKTSGLSPVEFIQGNSGKEIYNNDFTDPFYLDDWYGDEFEQNVRNLGHIPPGSDYELILAIVKHTHESIVSVQANEEYISSVVETMQFQLGDQFSIEYPNDGQFINGASELYFRIVRLEA